MTEKARHLDFLVLGVPRSGTTSLASAVNYHPDLLCGIERFHYKIEPADILYPESFTDPKFQANPNNEKETLELMKQKGGGVRLVGNKSPRYYARLGAWRALNPAMKTVAIYRSPRGYLPSWRQRAGKEGDRWHPCQHGVFGLYEMFFMLRTLLAYFPEGLMVPFNACFKENPEVMRQVTAYLGADPQRYDQAAFLERRFNLPRREGAPKTGLSTEEEKMVTVADIDALDRLMERGRAFPIGEARAEIESYLDALPMQLADEAEAWLKARESQEMHQFMLYWVRQFPDLPNLPEMRILPPTLKTYVELVYGEAKKRKYAHLALKPRVRGLMYLKMFKARMGARV